MCVGLKIKSYLKDNGITQTFVANKTGIPLQKLNLSLNGMRRLDFGEYELICGALCVGTDRFLEPKLPEWWFFRILENWIIDDIKLR